MSGAAQRTTRASATASLRWAKLSVNNTRAMLTVSSQVHSNGQRGGAACRKDRPNHPTRKGGATLGRMACTAGVWGTHSACWAQSQPSSNQRIESQTVSRGLCLSRLPLLKPHSCSLVACLPSNVLLLTLAATEESGQWRPGSSQPVSEAACVRRPSLASCLLERAWLLLLGCSSWRAPGPRHGRQRPDPRALRAAAADNNVCCLLLHSVPSLRLLHTAGQ